MNNNFVQHLLSTAFTVFLLVFAVGSIPGGGKGSAQTRKLAEHLSTAETPCRIAMAGEEVQIKGFTYVIGQPVITDVETNVRFVSSSDERADFGKDGLKVMFLPIRFRNDQPVPNRDENLPQFYDANGVNRAIGPYHAKHYRKSKGLELFSHSKEYPANKWFETVFAYAVDPEAVEGGALQINEWVERKKPFTGERYGVNLDLVLVEVGAPKEATKDWVTEEAIEIRRHRRRGK